MQIKALIKFEYHTEEQAKIAFKSLEPDNMEFINSYIHENKLIYNLEGNSLKSILATLDDLFFCEMMMEKVLELKK
jgi:hypothetical protein